MGLARYTSRADTPAGLALGVVTLPWVHAALLLRDASLADEGAHCLDGEREQQVEGEAT